jgi:hypothetical protein
MASDGRFLGGATVTSVTRQCLQGFGGTFRNVTFFDLSRFESQFACVCGAAQGKMVKNGQLAMMMGTDCAGREGQEVGQKYRVGKMESERKESDFLPRSGSTAGHADFTDGTDAKGGGLGWMVRMMEVRIMNNWEGESTSYRIDHSFNRQPGL